jgi:PAS domain S-box-containing protein
VQKQSSKLRIFTALDDAARTRKAVKALCAAVPDMEPGICPGSKALAGILAKNEECIIITDVDTVTAAMKQAGTRGPAVVAVYTSPDQIQAARILAEKHGFVLIEAGPTKDDFSTLTAFAAGLGLATAQSRGLAARLVRRYEDLVHALPDIVYELDPDGIITFINDSVSILGYQAEQLVGKHYSVLLHEDELAVVDRDQVLGDYTGHNTGQALSPKLFNERRCIERRTSELEVRLKKNPDAPGLRQDIIGEVTSYGEVSAAGEYTRDGERQFRGSVGIIRDMTLRRKSEEMLRKLYQAVDQLNPSVFVVNHAFEVEYVNPSFFLLTGHSPADVIGHTIFRFFGFMPETSELIRRQIQDGFESKQEVLAPKAREGQYWAEVSMAPIRSPNGVVTHAIAIVDDISSRKSMEELLKTAKEEAESANQAKSRFLASMTHELKSPIAGILAASRLMQLNQDDAPRRLESILMNAQALLDIMNGILDYVRSDSGETPIQNLAFPFRPFMESVLKPFYLKAAGKGLRLESETTSSEIIRGDPDRLGRAIGILVDNAVKFTESGTIHVWAGLECKEGNIPHVRVSVKDTGVGIGSVDKDRIFRPFTQLGILRGSAARGAGIGLALARNIVAAMGGEIRVDSDPGVGSVFTLIAPAGIPVATVAPAPMPYSILVVDDNEVNLEYMRTLIENTGLRVLAASGAAEAMHILDEHYVDAAVLDIMMPGYSGTQLATAIRGYTGNRYSPNMPLFAMTAHDTDEIGSDEALFQQIFSKPTDIRKLSATIAEVMAARERICTRFFDAGYSDKPQSRGAALAYLASSAEAALDAIGQAMSAKGENKVDVRTEAGRISTAFQRFACAHGVEITKLFIEHYPHEDPAIMRNLLDRIGGMLRRAIACCTDNHENADDTDHIDQQEK